MATMDSERTIPTPVVFPEAEHYWQAATEGRLLIKRCEACQGVHHFPRSICPLCGADQTQWIEAKGHGSIYSVSVTRRGPGAPFAIAYVTLDEGVTLLSNIVDCDLDSVRIGDRVEVIFKPTADGPPVPMFRPCKAGSSTPELRGAT